jgi:23S rRNA pseudouridine1911/1915/1917 synthase
MFTVETSMRLDAFLAKNASYVSRVKATDAVRAGLVTVNGRIARKGALVLEAGDVIVVSDSGIPLTETLLTPVDLHLPILFEDAACIVINKPAGISVHPAAGIPKAAPTILHGAAFLLEERSLPFSQSAVLAHRLDKDTTGCLLLAKNADAHALLQKQFAERIIDKRYLALVAGVPSPAAAMIDAPIGRHSGDRKKMAVLHAVQNRREAQTTYRTLEVSAAHDAALLECELHTGRTHQLRVHLKSIGYPILGDSTYFSHSSEDISKRYSMRNLMLHAWSLKFSSPADGKTHKIQCPIPSPFCNALTALGISFTS